MSTVIVQYRAKTDRADENEAYIRNVFAELEASDSEGIRYAAFKSEDGVSFFHIASIETEDGSNPLQATEAFQKFVANIEDRCDDPPVVTNLTQIGSYRILGG